MYTEKNVVLSATHTHSGPAGFMQYVLFNIPNLGYVKQTHEGLVEGITRSIAIAHDSLAPGRWVLLLLMELEVLSRVVLVESEVEEQASINRSPTSYDANPEEERAR